MSQYVQCAQFTAQCKQTLNTRLLASDVLWINALCYIPWIKPTNTGSLFSYLLHYSWQDEINTKFQTLKMEMAILLDMAILENNTNTMYIYVLQIINSDANDYRVSGLLFLDERGFCIICDDSGVDEWDGKLIYIDLHRVEFAAKMIK